MLTHFLALALTTSTPGCQDLGREGFARLENQLMSSVQQADAAGVRALLGADFTLLSSESNGETIGAPAYIAGISNRAYLAVESFQFTALDVRCLGGASALVSSQLDWRSTYRGQPWNAVFLMTDVWELQDSWKLVRRHSSYWREDLARIVRERDSATPAR